MIILYIFIFITQTLLASIEDQRLLDNKTQASYRTLSSPSINVESQQTEARSLWGGCVRFLCITGTMIGLAALTGYAIFVASNFDYNHGDPNEATHLNPWTGKTNPWPFPPNNNTFG